MEPAESSWGTWAFLKNPFKKEKTTKNQTLKPKIFGKNDQKLNPKP